MIFDLTHTEYAVVDYVQGSTSILPVLHAMAFPIDFRSKILASCLGIGKVHILAIVTGCGTRFLEKVEPFYLKTKHFIPIQTKSFSRFKIECDLDEEQVGEESDNDKYINVVIHHEKYGRV